MCLLLTSAQKKVSVTEVSFDSSVEDIQWLGGDHKTCLLKTAKGRLYRSVDFGKSWNEITSSLTESSAPGSPYAPSAVKVDNVVVHPADKNVVLVQGSKHTHFISEDAGRTFRRLKQKAPIHQWQFHPSKSRWALLSTWTEACENPGLEAKRKAQDEETQPCTHILYVTKDAGKTFSIVSSYVVQFSWGDSAHKQENRVWFTHHRHKKGDQARYGGWAKHVDLAYTDDFGKTTSTAVHSGNKFLVSNGFLFVARLQDATRQTVELEVSTDGGKSFQTAKLPYAGELQEKSYTILDTSEGAVMLHVNHGDHGRSGTGNVYISDEKGVRYSLSLPANVRSTGGECEFDKVLSLDGVYIANFKDDATETVSNDRLDGGNIEDAEKAQEEEEEETTATDVELKRKKRKKKAEDVVKTVVSYDKGGVWSYLKPPKVDSTGEATICYTKAGEAVENCWLHLHGVTNFHNYAPFYSMDNAVGLILGTGNLGAHLRYEPDEVNTYLSRDGGVTWVEAHKGAYIYEFGDHGGLIVMADDLRKTRQVVFSWNEGQSWYDFELGPNPVEVDNIVIEPNASAVEFLLYGTRGDSGVLFHLDFAALGQPACKGIWAADSVSSDYENWTPSTSAKKDGCSLGRQVTYTRRKQTSECFNGQDFQRPVFKKNCECTEEDFECEFGFARKIGSTVCAPEDPNLTADTCTAGGFFYMDAYRKVPGDTCEAGWVPSQVPVPCPAHAPFSRTALIVLGVVLVAAVALLMLGVVAGGSNPSDAASKGIHVALGLGQSSSREATKENFSKASRWRAVGGVRGALAAIGQAFGRGVAAVSALIGGRRGANLGGRFGDVQYSQVGKGELGFGEGVGDFTVEGDHGLDDDDLAAGDHDDAPPLLSYTAAGAGGQGKRDGMDGGRGDDVEAGGRGVVHRHHHAAASSDSAENGHSLMGNGAAVPRLSPPPASAPSLPASLSPPASGGFGGFGNEGGEGRDGLELL
uniref:VPS10 domain-containing protein n=1 Tax=Chromera velia CCMP2878 TaxID=1169474 RepID=A0A0G4FQ72_9ALVE|eukprot:Cvel_18226.t1-p1 / transcript=Cvel_18226.t1 / gene=Cvel_18226 / organism=Chromera_velia_CCMP2878 / gene_product=Vacuolar protein sorting/targeting protein 10, putative / transcript_product=Vacuolar protein sorting/targeting protein 10, putative / location=Cvel_scaffold1498:50-3898(-) / protein_length=978 / sequence_SO=supercontig / SO=protein_coding / is_pseudo=false